MGANPNGIAFDGANMWVANEGGNTVTKLRASDGSTLGTFAVGTNPFGVAFDGVNIWVGKFWQQYRNQIAGEQWIGPLHLCRGKLAHRRGV